VDVQSWIRFRGIYGLQADAEWAVAVARNPAASDDFGVPLLPSEAQQVVDAASSAERLLPSAERYAATFSGFAGAWLDLPHVVIAFTGPTTDRRTEAAALFGSQVEVREVQYTLGELEAFFASVQSDTDWFPSIGEELVDTSLDLAANRVSLHLRSPDPAAEMLIAERFHDSGWMAFTYDGPAPWTGPRGDLEVTVVEAGGHPAAVDCLIGSTDPRVQQEQFGFVDDGRCFYEDLPAVKWTLRIDYDGENEAQTVFRDFVVKPNDVQRATVVVSATK
jgi:hypothetical protein